MADSNSDPTPLPHNAGALPWPTYQVGKQIRPVSLCLVPGLQAPDLLDGDDRLHCGISGTCETVGPGIGTLFQGSFADLDDAVPVSAAVMRLGQRGIRLLILKRSVNEAIRLQGILVRALDALQSDDYVPYCAHALEAESIAALLSVQASWLTGIMAIIGGPEDPLLRHPARVPAGDVPPDPVRRTRRIR